MRNIVKCLAALTALTAMSLGAPLAASAATRETAAASTTCLLDEVCIWTGTGYTGTLFTFTQTIANLGNYGAANVDASLKNTYAVNGRNYVRFYYAANFTGAWICVNPGTNLSNLANHTFNNGTGLPGYGQSVYYNVHSLSINNDVCTNPTR